MFVFNEIVAIVVLKTSSNLRVESVDGVPFNQTSVFE